MLQLTLRNLLSNWNTCVTNQIINKEFPNLLYFNVSNSALMLLVNKMGQIIY
jgi:hypothetical protein